MTTAEPGRWDRPRARDDLTGRARIRDAALAHFAEHGVAGATLRGIAESAGVSAGLVRHHFGSKDGLRQACDAFVVDFVRHGATHGVVDGQVGDPEFVAGLYRAAPPIMGYLARALTDGAPAGAALFDEMVRITEEVLPTVHSSGGSAISDRRAQAAVLTAMKLGITVLHRHLSRALGADAMSPTVAPRVSRALLEIISPHLLHPDTAEQMRTGLPDDRPDPTKTTT